MAQHILFEFCKNVFWIIQVAKCYIKRETKYRREMKLQKFAKEGMCNLEANPVSHVAISRQSIHHRCVSSANWNFRFLKLSARQQLSAFAFEFPVVSRRRRRPVATAVVVAITNAATVTSLHTNHLIMYWS